MNDLHAFFAARHFAELPSNRATHPLQVGKRIQALSRPEDDWEDADIVLLGCGEQRGRATDPHHWSHAPDAVRAALYELYDWHPEVKVTDMGNLLEGATEADTKAALRLVLSELKKAGKVAIVLGGSQDLTLQQYQAYRENKTSLNAAVIDSKIDLDEKESPDDSSYLMEMLTARPNYVRQFSQIGFQSYYTNPKVLETLDKLRFDCYRLGVARERLEEMEPVLRDCDLLSVDMQALRFSDAPFLKDASPNGFFGDEMCQLLRYAGMGMQLNSLGIYGYQPELDVDRQGAQLIAQMLWYFIDGYYLRQKESALAQEQQFTQYHVMIADRQTRFLKSKRTNRWWMVPEDNTFIPCSYNDYLEAANAGVPERWLRWQERLC